MSKPRDIFAFARSFSESGNNLHVLVNYEQQKFYLSGACVVIKTYNLLEMELWKVDLSAKKINMCWVSLGSIGWFLS